MMKRMKIVTKCLSNQQLISEKPKAKSRLNSSLHRNKYSNRKINNQKIHRIRDRAWWIPLKLIAIMTHL